MGADHISNLKRGRTLPSLPTLERLAQSLDVSLAELFDQAEGSREAANVSTWRPGLKPS